MAQSRPQFYPAVLPGYQLSVIAEPTYKFTATNYRTGEQIGFNEATQAWEPVTPDAKTLKKINNMAEQGDVGAQAGLGLLYAYGRGVPHDYELAAEWYRKASVQGYADAQERLGALYSSGTGVTQNSAEAAKWYGKAAAQGNAGAQVALGTLYALGQGVTQDYTQAAQWYGKAALQGNAEAQSELGTLYAQGLGVPQNYTTAAKWYKKAAAGGNTKARDELRVLYTQGLVSPQDTATVSVNQAAPSPVAPIPAPPPVQPPAQIASSAEATPAPVADEQIVRLDTSVTPAPAPTPAPVSQPPVQTASSTDKGQGGGVVSLGVEGFHDSYREPAAFPTLLDNSNYGSITASYTHTSPRNYIFGADGRLSYGSDHYRSDSGSSAGSPQYEGELRLRGGGTFLLMGDVTTLYTGVGGRFFYDNSKGTVTDLGLFGYDRRIAQLYVPVGMTWHLPVGSWLLSSNLEYDQLIKGWVNSRLQSLGGYDIRNTQTRGYGLRGELMFRPIAENSTWEIGPFFRYWNVADSNTYTAPDTSQWLEPQNTRIQVGAALRVLY